MAATKPTFAKMGLKLNTDVTTITIGEQDIEVKQYLPVNEKLMLIGRVINNSADENNFANPIKLDVFTALEIVFTYTNISFEEYINRNNGHLEWEVARPLFMPVISLLEYHSDSC